MIWKLLLISYIAIKNVKAYSIKSMTPMIDVSGFQACDYPSSILDAATPFFFQSPNILSPFPCDVQASYKSLADSIDSCRKKSNIYQIGPLLENKENDQTGPGTAIDHNDGTSDATNTPDLQHESPIDNSGLYTMPLVDDNPIANIIPIDTKEPVANIPSEAEPSIILIPLETENPFESTSDPGPLDTVNVISNIGLIDIESVASDPAVTGDSVTSILSIQDDDIVTSVVSGQVAVPNEFSKSETPPKDAIPILEDSPKVPSEADNSIEPSIDSASALVPGNIPLTV